MLETGHPFDGRQASAWCLLVRQLRLGAFLHIHPALEGPLPFERFHLEDEAERDGSRSRSVDTVVGMPIYPR